MYFEVSVQPPGGSFTNVCNFTSTPACSRGTNGQVVSTSYTASTLGTYSWRVRSWDGWTDGAGTPNYSSYSVARTFTKISASPDAPSLVSPANAANSNSKTWTLTWSGNDPDNGPTTPMYYEVSVQPPGGSLANICDFTASPTCPRGSSGQTVNTSYTANQPGTYSWRVRAYDGANYSGYSATMTFTYSNTPPETPTLVAPVTGGYTIGEATLQFRSSDPDSGPNSQLDYELTIRSEDGSFVSGFGISSGHTGTNNQVLSYNLAPQKRGLFYWKVRAWDGAAYSSFSEERTVFIDYDCP